MTPERWRALLLALACAAGFAPNRLAVYGPLVLALLGLAVLLRELLLPGATGSAKCDVAVGLLAGLSLLLAFRPLRVVCEAMAQRRLSITGAPPRGRWSAHLVLMDAQMPEMDGRHG